MLPTSETVVSNSNFMRTLYHGYTLSMHPTTDCIWSILPQIQVYNYTLHPATDTLHPTTDTLSPTTKTTQRSNQKNITRTLNNRL